MKKTSAVILSVLMIVTACLSVSAISLETVENAAEAAGAVIAEEKEKAALAAEINPDVDRYHSTYGTLIHYNDFDSLGVEPDTVISSGTSNNQFKLDTSKVFGRAVTISNASIGDYTVTAVTAPNGADTTNMAIAVTTKNTGGNKWPQAQFSFDNSDLGAGTYTIVCDLLRPEGKTAGSLQFWFGGNYRSNGTNLTQGVWTSASYSTDVTSAMNSAYVYISQSNVATDCFYIDNLKLYYKQMVNIDAEKLNLPEDVTGGYLNYGNTPVKEAFTSEGFDVMVGSNMPGIYVPGYTFLGWFDSNDNKVVIETLTTTDFNYKAKWAKWAPGLNMLTGTTEKLTFEDGFRGNVSISDMGIVELVDNISAGEGSENTSSKVLMAKKGANGGYYAGLCLPVIYEAGRTYTIKYDVYTTGGAQNQSWFYDLNGKDTTPGFANGYGSAQEKWCSVSADVTPKAANDARKHVFIQNKLVESAAVKNIIVYYDNVAFYPWYKVTYMAADGETVIKTVNDVSWNKTSYTVLANLNQMWEGEGTKKFLGWSTTKGATEAMETVALANADVVLYPVFGDVGENAFAYPVAYANETTTVKVDTKLDGAKSTWKVGATGATVAFDEANNGFTVTGAGYSGEITFNLTFENGSTADAKVYVVGGTKWRPGLNVYTGTDKPLDFEVLKTANLSKIFKSVDGGIGYFSIQKNPEKTGANTSDKILSIANQYTYAFNMDLATPIEAARSMYYRFDLKSNKGSYLMINTWGSSGIYREPAVSTTWKKNEYTIRLTGDTGSMKDPDKTNTIKNGLEFIGVGGKTGTYAYETEGKSYYYLDNLLLIPAYKITYKCGGGDVVDYILYSDEANKVIATSYTINNDVSAIYTGIGIKRHIGWATTEGATEPMTTVALANADVVLYPVFEDTGDTVIGTLMSGATGTVGAVRFAKLVDAEKTTVDAGATDAVVVYNEAANGYDITASGYSGIITINAVYSDTTTEKVEVKLLGGEKWKPGLNLLTGTTGTFGFESDEENELSFSFDKVSVIENPVENGVNDSAYVVNFSGTKAMFPIMTTKMTQVVEKERSMLVNMDVSGDWQCLWLISKADTVYADYSGWWSGDRPITGWNNIRNYTVQTGTGKTDFSMTRIQAKSASDANGTSAKELYIDNIAFIPAYKFTYVDIDGTETVVYKIVDENSDIITSWTPVFASGATKYTVNGGEKVLEGAYTLANEDVVFTAVAPEFVTDKKVTSRFDVEDGVVTGGIRFKFTVSDEDKTTFAKEYGFIVARQSHLTKYDSELTFDFKHPTEDKELFVKGVSYEKSTGKNIYFDKTETHWIFTGVCVGIPTNTAETVKENLVARPYMVVTVGDKDVCVYGPANSYSLGQAMKDVKTAAGEDYTNNQEYVDAIVDLYEQE